MGRWHDLGVRTVSALVLLAVAVVCILYGGLVFRCFVIMLTVAMVWELLQMARHDRITKRYVGSYLGVILLGAVTMVLVRENLSPTWIVWLVGVVVVTDIAGYVVGRAIGGPKAWPRVSPSKTWSGVIGGWIAALLLGLILAPQLQAGWLILPASLLLSLASQIGDVCESGLKRRAEIKDSSKLIPGHGGFLDRFDGLIGASAVLFFLALFFGFPKGLL